jgi:hypothetical protein
MRPSKEKRKPKAEKNKGPKAAPAAPPMGSQGKAAPPKK